MNEGDLAVLARAREKRQYNSGLAADRLKKLLAAGKTDREIAAVFHISKEAVSKRRRKLGFIRPQSHPRALRPRHEPVVAVEPEPFPVLCDDSPGANW